MILRTISGVLFVNISVSDATIFAIPSATPACGNKVMPRYFFTFGSAPEIVAEMYVEIIEAYKNEKRNVVWDVSILSDYEQIKYAIRGRLINTEKNISQ